MSSHLEGAPLTEFIIESVLRDGIGDLRANPEKLDNLFARFNLAFFENQYGQSKIDEIKTYIQNNQIKIVHAFGQVPTRVPCFSIQIMSSVESDVDQQFGNEYIDRDDDKTPNAIVTNVVPVSYNTNTGRLQVDPATNLSTICPNLVYSDNSGNKFTILSGNSNLSGDKYINIGTGQNPDLAGPGEIQSPVDFARTERKIIRLRETINIGCHATNHPHLAKFLYTILTYILKSRQESLIDRGVQIDRTSASIFNREDNFGTENMYSRYLQMDFLTEFIWDSKEANIIDCFDLDVFSSEVDSIEVTQTSGEDDC